LANLKLRDRDGILTSDGFVFRVFGYSHPPGAFICDAEYASENIFKSSDSRAPRTAPNKTYYKFYNDEGWKLISSRFQKKYAIYLEMLGKKSVGVHQEDIAEIRKPEERLQAILKGENKDALIKAMERVLSISLKNSGLKSSNFGVFGSILHGFHHPKYSDIDLVVYGKKENAKMCKTLEKLYSDKNSGFRNEFESEDAMKGKDWRFKNFDVADFVWHQRRKLIYGLFDDTAGSGRVIKAEFEPVKAWSEIKSEYDPKTRITQKGWARIKAQIVGDEEAPFIPSIYKIKPLEVLSGPEEAFGATRVYSFMEEFRAQARKKETVIVEGNLEEVVTPKGKFCQITLTYCPRYYEQVLKVLH
jgi:predicted nucleotidyltransferase